LSFICLVKCFNQKSFLLRLIFYLQKLAEFHFHGVRFLRSLRIPKAFFTNQYSVISHWGFRYLIRETLLLSSFIEYLRNIKQRLFNFPSNTYSYGLAASVSKFQPKIFDELGMRFRVPIGIYAFITDLAATGGAITRIPNVIW